MCRLRPAVALCLCVAWMLALAFDGAWAGVLTSGLEGQALTVQNEALWLRDIHFKTPRDYDKAAVPGRLYEFETASSGPAFEQIQKLTFNPLEVTWLSSRPEVMEYYQLGDVRRALPPPPDWRRSIGQIPPWSRAQATLNANDLPFINHAIFCWAQAEAKSSSRSQVYLFRQALEVPQPELLVRATLRLATNVQLDEVWLNEYPLHLAGRQAVELAEYEVRPLLIAGQNLLAIKLHEQPGMIERNDGLAFNLELVSRKPSMKHPLADPLAALLLNEDGDRLWGRIQQIQGDRIELNTPYGLYTQPWEACTGLLLPNGWAGPQVSSGLFSGLLGGSGDPAVTNQPYGLPLSMRPEEIQDCLLLTDGRVTTARPAYEREGVLYFEGAEGSQYSLPVDQVVGAFPQRTVSWTFRRPDPQGSNLYCQLTTLGGDRISGLLRWLDGRKTIVETPNGDMMTLRSDWVSELHFPFHASMQSSPTQIRIGLVPQAGGQEGHQLRYRNLSRDVQSAVYSIGAEGLMLPLETMADANKLIPVEHPVLVSFDPVGEYLHTLNAPGDAQQAMLNYLEQGGVLVLLSHGGALRTAVVNRNGQIQRTVVNPSMTQELGLKTRRPSPQPQDGVIAFDHPPNTAGEVYFQRTGQLPRGLQALPRRIAMAPMLSAPFYPMVNEETPGTVIYELKDSSDVTYGPALTLIPRGQGTIVLVDHLLWYSCPDDRPFTQTALPVLLRWALEISGH